MCTDLHFACMEAFYTFLSLLQLRKQQHGQSRRKEIAAVARAVFVEDGEELFMNVSFGSLSDGFRVRLTPEKYPSSKGKQ